MSRYEEDYDYFGVDENFDFNTGINKLLDQEVEKRLAERVKDYHRAIEREEKSQKTISDLRNENHKMQLELKGAEKTFKKEGSDEAKREMLGGFKLGDEVWFIKRNYFRENCPTCLGDRKVIVELKGEEVKIYCPTCKGYGHKDKNNETVESGIVKEINIHTWAGGLVQTEMYIEPKSYRSNDTVNVRLGNFFKTKEEGENKLKQGK